MAEGVSPEAGDDDAAWAAQAAEQLRRQDAGFAARFDAGEDMERLLMARVIAVDGLVRQAWSRSIPADAPLTLFAIGGYGRGELFPRSDIDLLVLVGDEACEADTASLSRLFALLWDAGLPVGHAVRTLAECTRAAADDLTVMTSLIEARPLVASPEMAARLEEAVSVDRVWPAAGFFAAKREELRQRHARFGDTADNLEPNIKEGPGGLRDIHTLRWMARRVFGVRDIESLIPLGHLGLDEYAAIEREWRVLSRLRYGLHLVAGKREERLRFDYQKTLAARLQHIEDADNAAVEQMMQGFYRSAAILLRIGERLLQRYEEQIEGDVEAVPLDPEFAMKRGYLVARDEFWPGGDMSRVLALFALWAEHPEAKGLHSRTARALAESLHALPAYDQAGPGMREAFVELLRGPGPVRTLERMARLGVLGRWIPAFARVSGRMQFDLFHVYTVDQHTLAVLRNLASFSTGIPDERFSMAHEVWPLLRKPELLLVAGLFHDIAKGRGGDHSELGAVDARAFCEAHGYGAGDTALVEWLVLKHLLMSVTAQKQDISDPAVIHRFAVEVADRERLDYLYLLTCADIAGTSPQLWNAWKDRLLADLRTATRYALRRGLEHRVGAADRIAETRDKARGLLVAEGVDGIDGLFARMPDTGFLRARPDQIVWQAMALAETPPGATVVRVRRVAGAGDALEVFVHAPDRDGLFAAIAITLDRLGLAIQQARALDGPQRTIFDTFQVLSIDQRQAPDIGAIERKLATVLAGSLDVRPARRAQPRHLRHFRVVPQIDFDTAGDGRRTLMSLVCTDRPGLLADIAQVLRQQRIRVHDARIATFGARAEDVFLVSDREDRPLDDIQRDALCEALQTGIDGDTKA